MKVAKKRRYKAIDVKKISLERLEPKVRNQRICVGLDAAKEDIVFALNSQPNEPIVLIKFKHPAETRLVVQLLSQLPVESLEVAMEPTGTYGDALRELLWQADIPVYRVNPKATHDSQEVYDNVPSLHDPKAASIIAKLHMDGLSRPWPIKEEYGRQLDAAIRLLDFYNDPYHRNLNRLEAQLARHWPELTGILTLEGATLLELLGQFGSPAAVEEKPQQACQLMRKVGGPKLAQEKIEQVLESAQHSVGMKMSEDEQKVLMEMAQETRRLQKKTMTARKEVARLSEKKTSVNSMARTVGKSTATVLVAKMGDFTEYSSPASLLKGMGLNLKIRSSGKYKGHLKITKRGCGTVRQYMWLAVGRWLQKEPIVRAWYEKKVARDGGVKQKAIVALMRKLAVGLWHTAQGKPFDLTKLFDVSQLNLSA